MPRPTQSLEETNVDRVSTTASTGERDAQSSMYLLVFEGESSRLHRLPRTGTITIGRAPECTIRVESSAASRRHVEIVMANGTATLRDLGSQNGTLVNGDRMVADEPRELVSRDVFVVGGCTIAFHNAGRGEAHRRLVSRDELRRRLGGEVERSLRYQRQFTVLNLFLAAPATTELARRSFAGVVMRGLRGIDSAAWDGDDAIVILLPETEEDEADAVAERTLTAIGELAPDATIGRAMFPGDGADPDELIAGARAAARGAKPGTIAAASGAIQRIELAGRTVLVCDSAMARMYALIERLAASDLPVLIWGETGTGKELAASALHASSPRADGPFVVLNCAAIHENLVESELFGHEKGAFTGAQSAKAGLFEAASGGTVFLDEIGELSLPNQAKLLRVLETRRITRVGDVRERPVDIRLVAATNRDLQEEVARERFRQDLYFRLSAAMLWLPPLRERPRELPVLAQLFLSEACERLGRPLMSISPEALIALASHAWPGNVRELKNVMDYAAAAYSELVLEPWHLHARLGDDPSAIAGEYPTAGGTGPTRRLPLRAPTPGTDEAPTEFRPLGEEIQELERTRIQQALRAANGNQTQAAALIHMPLRTFMNKLKRYKLSGKTILDQR